MPKTNFLNSFWLKIIAIITMTIDHVALALMIYGYMSPFEPFYLLLQGIGRLSLPLFTFAIVEGILHTHSKKNYLLRLGISTLSLSVVIFILEMTLGISDIYGNIFVDLFLGATILYCVMLPKYKKLFILIPISISILLTFNFIPAYIRPLYHLYGISLIIAYYGAHMLSLILSKNYASRFGYEKKEDFQASIFYQNLRNILMVLALIGVNCIFYIVANYSKYVDTLLTMDFQMYSILSGAFLLFYNSRKGYNSKWFQYGCYLYYPLHILVIFGITYLALII